MKELTDNEWLELKEEHDKPKNQLSAIENKLKKRDRKNPESIPKLEINKVIKLKKQFYKESNRLNELQDKVDSLEEDIYNHILDLSNEYDIDEVELNDYIENLDEVIKSRL